MQLAMTESVALMKPIGPDPVPSTHPDRYKWLVLVNTTLAMLLATVDGSIVLIALPNIFRGIGVDPLDASNSFYLLWMILGFMVVVAVLVVSFGRLGDMLGRVKMFNLGFAIFTFFSLLLAICWMDGTDAAIYLIVMRLFQAVGAAFLIANSSAILIDAFPEHQRGMAVGVNQISGMTGSFVGLVLGGLLAPINWRLIFLVAVPIGLAGTLWSYVNLRELPFTVDRKIDWPGNITFALGLVSIMVGVTYGIQPYGGHTMGWTSPLVICTLTAGVILLIAFGFIESRSDDPMFHLTLFKIRAFSAGSISTLFASMARGGLMFVLVIWLQGVWLPLHGYDFAQTPLWAGVAMLPLTLGFICSAPVAGILSDRYGPRPFTVAGMLGAALTFVLLEMMPVNFDYWSFAVVLFFNAFFTGIFSAPNRTGVMNALPPQHRGVGSGMNSTFMNGGQVISIGVFFTLMIIGISSGLHAELSSGLISQGVPAASAARAAGLPPVSTLFAALLGYNPLQHLLGAHVLGGLTPAARATVISRGFFPSIISGAFRNGLRLSCDFAVVCCLIATFASSLRGGRFIYVESIHGPKAHHPGSESVAALTTS